MVVTQNTALMPKCFDPFLCIFSSGCVAKHVFFTLRRAVFVFSYEDNCILHRWPIDLKQIAEIDVASTACATTHR